MTMIAKAIGPYSAYRRKGELLITSGQLPLNLESNKIEGKTVYEQARQSLENISNILKVEGSDLSNVLKLTVYMADLTGFSEVNQAFEEVLSDPYPARTAFEVSKLPLGALVEIEATAVLD